MSNKQKYQDIFARSLSIETKKFNEKIKYNEIPEWDSIGHMTLMSGLEEGFGITIDTDDINLMNKLAPFYTDSATSLIGYIQKMNEGIAKQKLFGKGINPDTLEFEEDFEGTIGGLYADKLLDKENTY